MDTKDKSRQESRLKEALLANAAPRNCSRVRVAPLTSRCYSQRTGGFEWISARIHSSSPNELTNVFSL